MQYKLQDETDRQIRYTSVDIVKGIAIIMVILTHYGQNYSIGIARVCNYLRMGCPIFFVTSGFAIMCLINSRYKGTLNSKNVGQFYYSRFKALAPGWYIAIILIFLVNTILLFFTRNTLQFGKNRGLISIFCNLLFLNGILPFCNNNVVPGGWYIGTTAILYLLTPIIQKRLNKSKNRKMFFIFSSFVGMVLWAILYLVFRDGFTNNGFGYYFFLIHYPEYLLGILLYYDISSHFLQRKHINMFLLYAIVSLLSAIVLFYSDISWRLIPSAWMTAIATYFIMYTMISTEKHNKGNIISKVLEGFGKNSFFIFLLHAFFAWPFVRISLMILGDFGLSQTVSFFVLIPVTLFLSYIAGLFLRVIVKKVTLVIFQRKTA
ncbi:MAG: acyltransferase [Lachnospiraceae bacterium]|nr:acyltransferase [Lachnospiraceae bacterium]